LHLFISVSWPLREQYIYYIIIIIYFILCIVYFLIYFIFIFNININSIAIIISV